MTEPKPLASLSGSLLARKGAARPAMRPQMQPFHRFGEEPAHAHGHEHEHEHLEDLGWNDMGEPHERPHADILPLTPAPINLDAVAEARAEDRAAAEQLARNAQLIAKGQTLDDLEPAEKPEVIRQREDASARLEGQQPAFRPKPDSAVNGAHAPAPAPASAAKRKPAKPRKSALAQGRRAAFTLRLDGERHLKLRLACTISNRSAQQIVTEALDRLIENMPELEALAAQVKRH